MAQGPPVPAYIFRGHEKPIHALHFFAANSCFASGDSDGWLVIWSLATRRPIAVWKAHEGSVMGVNDWQSERLITHGRDHKLRVWQLRLSDLESMSLKLPVDGATHEESKQPWLLHSMDINALNFCAFATCFDPDVRHSGSGNGFKPLLLATPNGLDHGQIDMFQLPSEQRVSKVSPNKNKDSPMVMAVSLFVKSQTHRLNMVSGHEDGTVIIVARKQDTEALSWSWETLATYKPHGQPVLAVDVLPDLTSCISSSADARLAKLHIPDELIDHPVAEKINDTKHAGQQDLKIRSDGRICATAGWDKNVRVYSAKTLKELAVLVWHREGCYATAFATIDPEVEQNSIPGQLATTSDSLTRFRTERNLKAARTHWLAAGAKDGKVSLWDIY